MKPEKALWNEQQKALRYLLGLPMEINRAKDLFLTQHAMVHSGEVSGKNLPSFEDDIWENLSDQDARFIPTNIEHSIVWCIWHLARIEDVTMNGLLAGSPQLLHTGNWSKRMRVSYDDTGNGMDAAEISALSMEIDISSLRQYRIEVGRRTREIVIELDVNTLTRKVEPTRLDQILADGSVRDQGLNVVEYWKKLTGAGLLLMPPTRHCVIHLNEALRIKLKCLSLKDRRYV